jgi:hypothetical protein
MLYKQLFDSLVPIHSKTVNAFFALPMNVRADLYERCIEMFLEGRGDDYEALFRQTVGREFYESITVDGRCLKLVKLRYVPMLRSTAKTITIGLTVYTDLNGYQDLQLSSARPPYGLREIRNQHDYFQKSSSVIHCTTPNAAYLNMQVDGVPGASFSTAPLTADLIKLKLSM